MKYFVRHLSPQTVSQGFTGEALCHNKAARATQKHQTGAGPFLRSPPVRFGGGGMLTGRHKRCPLMIRSSASSFLGLRRSQIGFVSHAGSWVSSGPEAWSESWNDGAFRPVPRSEYRLQAALGRLSIPARLLQANCRVGPAPPYKLPNSMPSRAHYNLPRPLPPPSPPSAGLAPASAAASATRPSSGTGYARSAVHTSATDRGRRRF